MVITQKQAEKIIRDTVQLVEDVFGRPYYRVSTTDRKKAKLLIKKALQNGYVMAYCQKEKEFDREAGLILRKAYLSTGKKLIYTFSILFWYDQEIWIECQLDYIYLPYGKEAFSEHDLKKALDLSQEKEVRFPIYRKVIEAKWLE